MSEHQLTLCKNGLDAKCVAEVKGFSEKEVKLALLDDRKITVTGEGLKIVGFSRTTGDLCLSGKITQVCYREKGEKLIKRLLK